MASASYESIYEDAIASGASPMFADMLASRKAPGCTTDREFLAGLTNGDEAPKLRARTKERYGFTPGPGDVYVPSLSRIGMPYDPQAWVPPGDARGHVKRVCERMGAGCDGMVKTKRREVEPEKPVPVADSIVKRLVRQKIKQNPALAVKPLRELKEQVIHEHGPKR